eukprot:16850_4
MASRGSPLPLHRPLLVGTAPPTLTSAPAMLLLADFDKVKEERREAEKLPMEFIRNKQLRPEKTAAESGTAVRNFAVAATRN